MTLAKEADLVTRLRDCRYRAGLTQREAALRSGVGPKSLSAIETGDRFDRLKVSTLLKLLATYHCAPERFFAPSWEVSEDMKQRPNWKGLKRTMR